MKTRYIKARDLRDIARCINKIMSLRVEYPAVFKPIEEEIYDAATALVSISTTLTTDECKYIFGDKNRLTIP